MPSHGLFAACVACPKYWTLRRENAAVRTRALLCRMPGCEMREMSTPSYAPFSRSRILPPRYPSSPGVPNRTTLPHRLCRRIISAVASPAANEAAAIKLWPHAWPRFGSASTKVVNSSCRYHEELDSLPISTLKETVGPALPLSWTATHAVSIPYADGVTIHPFSADRRNSVRAWCALCSWKASSGFWCRKRFNGHNTSLRLSMNWSMSGKYGWAVSF